MRIVWDSGPLVLHEHAVCCAAAGDSSLTFARLSFTYGALVRDGGQWAVILSQGQLTLGLHCIAHLFGLNNPGGHLAPVCPVMQDSQLLLQVLSTQI